jgi:hypothetical protein
VRSDAWTETVRIAQKVGGIEVLLPVGITSLRDCPYTVFEAIRMALVVISWEENIFKEEEMPPKRIWTDGEKLKDWWDAVKRNRDAEGPGDKHIEDPVENGLIG